MDGGSPAAEWGRIQTVNVFQCWRQKDSSGAGLGAAKEIFRVGLGQTPAATNMELNMTHYPI